MTRLLRAAWMSAARVGEEKSRPLLGVVLPLKVRVNLADGGLGGLSGAAFFGESACLGGEEPELPTEPGAAMCAMSSGVDWALEAAPATAAVPAASGACQNVEERGSTAIRA